MSLKRKAFFRCEASPGKGAGHAMRCSVLADALSERGWICHFVTAQEAYDFIPALARFARVNPDQFYADPIKCDLLVVDHYDLDAAYESHFRPYSGKIMVIDDLADRIHDCDILLDQTYGRNAEDYQPLVPATCGVLAGSKYALLRSEFAKLRPQALEKRRNTTEIKKILVTMGGSDPKNFTLEALKLIKESGFEGDIDVVLGFSAPHRKEVKAFADTLPNRVTLHMNADMPQLIYEADLAIGAAGSSVWERCCLGLPQFLMATADNQKANFNSLKQVGFMDSFQTLIGRKDNYRFIQKLNLDGFGVNRLLRELEIHEGSKKITFREVTEQDKDKIFCWQQIKEVRMYFFNQKSPSFNEHNEWFLERIMQKENPYWIICYDNEDCGVMSLSYDYSRHAYGLSWFIIPEKRGRGLGSEALRLAVYAVHPLRIYAFVKEDNVASHNVFKKLNFSRIAENCYISEENVGRN